MSKRRERLLEEWHQRIVDGPVPFPRIAGSGPVLLIGQQPDAFCGADLTDYMLPSGTGRSVGDWLMQECGLRSSRVFESLFSRCSLMPEPYPPGMWPKKYARVRAEKLTLLIYSGKWQRVVYLTRRVAEAFRGPHISWPFHWQPMTTRFSSETMEQFAATAMYPTAKGNAHFTPEKQEQSKRFWMALAHDVRHDIPYTMTAEELAYQRGRRDADAEHKKRMGRPPKCPDCGKPIRKSDSGTEITS